MAKSIASANKEIETTAPKVQTMGAAIESALNDDERGTTNGVG